MWNQSLLVFIYPCCLCCIRADSRFAPSQWETALLCNDVSQWLGASIVSALCMLCMHSVFYLWLSTVVSNERRHYLSYKQRVLMHRHQGWNVRHGLCHIYMRYLYIYELFIAFVCFVVCPLFTGGHRTRVAAVTLDNMAEDAVAASASLRQILTVSVRYCGSAFVSWLSMLWDTLTQNPELQWFGISPQFRLKVSRGDEGVGHVCFPGDEGVGRPWRGYRRVQVNLGPA